MLVLPLIVPQADQDLSDEPPDLAEVLAWFKAGGHIGHSAVHEAKARLLALSVGKQVGDSRRLIVHTGVIIVI